MSVAYQSWEVGTGPKVYQCVMDAAPYRWQQQQQHHHQAESTKTNLSTRSIYVHSSHESSEATKSSCVAQSTATASPVSSSTLRHGECGPVSSFVLPTSACQGGERVLLIGEDLELVNSRATVSGCLGWNNNNGQRNLSNGFSYGVLKVHPHEHDFRSYDRGTPPLGLSTDCLVLPTAASPSLFQDCVGPALSSSSSSIGAGGVHSLSASEDGSDDNSGDGEVQSALRGSLNLSSLEDSLPIKRGLSRYFIGQSKSFGCLSDALSTSLAKPANPYAKRRKNFSLLDDRHRSFPPLSRKANGCTSGISKKTSFGNRSNLAVAVAMEAAQEEEEEHEYYDDEEEDKDHATPLPRISWDSHKNNAVPPRSYSLSDLQGAGRGG